MAMVQNGEDIFRKVSTPGLRCTNVTDDTRICDRPETSRSYVRVKPRREVTNVTGCKIGVFRLVARNNALVTN